ncbi:hypothetical protein SAMN02745866_02236 [Alteromonadaceae bacterium Bs31]|nr:hypothetical protein SAMN02745866_02236 [Alteromonadaceae bacterium Bs31]
MALYQLVFYVPKSHVDEVKQAVFNVGAGKIGDYDSCCWQVEGSGQFRPLKGSKPYIGTLGEVEKVPEFRIELVLEQDLLEEAVAALKSAHPYEEPAYSAWPLSAC